MAEYSKQFSKAVAFDENTYPPDNPIGAKPIKVGEKTYWYDPSVENEHSALPKKDIEALIKTNEGILDIAVTVLTGVTIINGLIKQKTRTLTYENGLLISVSPESSWS